jgi:membrane associated rhomboid family serine protease
MSYKSGLGYDSLGMSLRPTPMVKRLLIANSVVFAIALVLPELVLDWLAFQPTRIVFRPWAPLTYMFVHGSLGHLFFNMLMLFFFGPPLEGRWGEREFLKFYVICGLGGAALSFLFMPVSIVGASGALYGVMIAFALNWPKAPIYVFGIFPVEARYLVGFMALVALLSATDSATGSNVAHLAHLGGLITGWIYLKADFRTGAAISSVRRATTKRRRLAIVPADESEDEAVTASSRPVKEDSALYDRVDAVLDKISAKGITALTPDELELLDEVSRKHRTN